MRKAIDKVIGKVLIALMLLMTVDVLIGVFTRYFMGGQVSWSEELARFLLIWIGILGAAYASGQGIHLAIDLLKPKLTDSTARTVSIAVQIIIALFALTALVIGGFRLIYITFSLGQLSAALRVPMYLVYSVVPLSGLLVIYYCADDIIQTPKSV